MTNHPNHSRRPRPRTVVYTPAQIERGRCYTISAEQAYAEGIATEFPSREAAEKHIADQIEAAEKACDEMAARKGYCSDYLSCQLGAALSLRCAEIVA